MFQWMISPCTSEARPSPCDLHPSTCPKINSLFPQLSSLSFLYHRLLFCHWVLPLVYALSKVHAHLCLLLQICSLEELTLLSLLYLLQRMYILTIPQKLLMLRLPVSFIAQMQQIIQFSSYTTSQYHWTINDSFPLQTFFSPLASRPSSSDNWPPNSLAMPSGPPFLDSPLFLAF